MTKTTNEKLVEQAAELLERLAHKGLLATVVYQTRSDMNPVVSQGMTAAVDPTCGPPGSPTLVLQVLLRESDH